MFENITAKKLLDEALALVSDKLDKREGAIIYDTLAPVCNELARAYADLELVLMQAFPQTAARKYLLLIAEQRGFKPKQATALVIKAYFDAEVDIGERFNMQQYNYTVTEALGNGMYKLVCETAGSAPNTATGTITPIRYISGLTQCSFEEIITAGTDEESTENFRSRFISSISQSAGFGGNIADYRAKLKAMNGIGKVKVFAANDWQGAGTVGVYITDENGGVVTAEFARSIQDILDPHHDGDGTGLAPIGHIVDVNSVTEKGAAVSVRLKAAAGTDETWLRGEINNTVDAYFTERNRYWENAAVSAYAGGIVAGLMDIEGVTDVTQVLIDGGQSVVCNGDEILKRSSTEAVIEYV